MIVLTLNMTVEKTPVAETHSDEKRRQKTPSSESIANDVGRRAAVLRVPTRRIPDDFTETDRRDMKLSTRYSGLTRDDFRTLIDEMEEPVGEENIQALNLEKRRRSALAEIERDYLVELKAFVEMANELLLFQKQSIMTAFRHFVSTNKTEKAIRKLREKHAMEQNPVPMEGNLVPWIRQQVRLFVLKRELHFEEVFGVRVVFETAEGTRREKLAYKPNSTGAQLERRRAEAEKEIDAAQEKLDELDVTIQMISIFLQSIPQSAPEQ